MRTLISRLTLVACALLLVPSKLVEAQVVTNVLLEWMKLADSCDDANEQDDFSAVMHVAMFEAVNSVVGKYQPYIARVPAAAGSSQDAAAAVAAHDVLVALCPSQSSAAAGKLKSSLAVIRDSASRDNGAAVGKLAAKQLLDARAGSHPMKQAPFMSATNAGVYVPTTRRWGMQQAIRMPWVMASSSELRPSPPPELTSDTWARDYDEIRRLGGKKSADRTDVQTDIAKFWSREGPSLVIRQLVGLPGRSLVDDARLLALVDMAGTDAYTAMMDGKYTYNFWRPVTAIRGGDLDGNDSTVADSTWEPLIGTPLHPEYPCGHCISAGAVGAVLEAEFGRSMPVLVVDKADAYLRRWRTARELIDEVTEARILGGVHYRFSAHAGREMGIAIGKLAVERYMKPIQTSRGRTSASSGRSRTRPSAAPRP